MKPKKMTPELLSCIAFHGHLCPGLAIGCQAARAALSRLKKSRACDEELVCITMTDSCAIDSIQVLTGCTAGKGNLLLHDYGKMTFLFLRRTRGAKAHGVRLALKPGLMRGRPGSATPKKREATALALLTLKPEELFSIKTITGYTVPERARIFSSQPCAVCGEPTMEPRLRVENGKMLCAECASEPYFRNR